MDNRRLAFRTEADTEGWTGEVSCKKSENQGVTDASGNGISHGQGLFGGIVLQEGGFTMMIVNWLLGILTGDAVVALATNSFQADTAGYLGTGSTSGILILLGSGLVGLGIRGRKKIFQGKHIDGRYLALGMKDVNFREGPFFSEHEEKRANMNDDDLKGKWKEI